MCGTAKGGWHPHHVTYAQHLKDRGKPKYDARNAMRLCVECHASHHNRSIVIPLAKLTDEHISYAFEMLGMYAHSYLARLYAVGDDTRLDVWLARMEEDERSTGTDAASCPAAIRG